MKILMVLTVASLLALSACGKAQSDDNSPTIKLVMANDGTNCYVLMQNGDAKGLSCK